MNEYESNFSRENKIFFSYLFSGFNIGTLIGIVGIIITILLWYLSPEEKISFSYILPSISILIFLVFIFGFSSYYAWKTEKKLKEEKKDLIKKNEKLKDENEELVEKVEKIKLPKIIKVIESYQEKICLLDSSKLFSHGILVSFYYREDSNYERLIGFGRVKNIQNNDKIQVSLKRLENILEKNERKNFPIIIKFLENDKNIIKNIIVRPTIPISDGNEFINLKEVY